MPKRHRPAVMGLVGLACAIDVGYRAPEWQLRGQIFSLARNYILVVDDQPHNVVALEAVLAGDDFTLVTASSGPEALKCVLAQDFAVIVLDIHMPGMDGFETAGLIRTRERSQSTPIIFLTAYDPAGARVLEGYRLGAVDYMYTPVDPEILRSKVAIFVELFRKTAVLEQQRAELAQLTADLLEREQQVVALNAALLERTAELERAGKRKGIVKLRRVSWRDAGPAC